ncbi:MAG: methyltransferase domain-containing protein [Minisyncoccia bacterium]
MFSDPQDNIRQFSLNRGDSVADFGAGSGFYTLAISDAVGSSGKVYAIDVQKDLLLKIKNLTNAQHKSNVDVLWADIEHVGGTKLRSMSLDAVIAANVFFQFENKENPCLEIKRILKKNGRVLVIDWMSSFGNTGPHPDAVFDADKAKQLFFQHGFEYDRDISAGAQHYGVIFRKK